MLYNEELINRTRKALAHISGIEEKKMFGQHAFMVNGKMCVCVGKNDMLFRIDMDLYNKEVHKDGRRPLMMKDKEAKGYMFISEEELKKSQNFDHWINTALEFNKTAKVSPKKKARIK